MRIIRYVFPLVFIVSLCACGNDDVREESVPQQHRTIIRPSTQTESVELFARLCSPLAQDKLTALAGSHQLTLTKQPSPTLFVFTWNDMRSVEEVMAALRREKNICGVEVNQTYHAEQPSVKPGIQ